MFTPQWISKIKSCSSSIIPISEHVNNKLIEAKSSVRRAAVLIPLCNRNGIASVMFNLRAQTVSTHKGQVSFPGGHIEPNETVEMAAIRETYEEMGESIGNFNILGTCQTVPAITGTLVTPV